MGWLVSQEDVEKAIEAIKQSPMVFRTPMVQNAESIFGFKTDVKCT